VGDPPVQPGTIGERLISNSVTPYLRTRVAVDGGQLRLDYWRIALGLAPGRRVRVTVPLEDVVEVRVAASVHLDRLVVGVALATVGVLVHGPTAVMIAVRVVALAMLLVGVTACLRVRTTSRRDDAPICLREVPRARRLAELIGVRAAGSGGPAPISG
jgi:hypothetical protein